MKKTIALIVVFFALNTFVYAQNFMAKKQKIVISEPAKSLKIGEKLQYSVEWLGIPVGKITLNVQGIKKIDGRECYHILARAAPNKFLAKFYDVEYIVHTYIDTKTFYTRRFEKTRRLKGEFNYVVIDFDREKKEARYQQLGSAPALDISAVREQVATSVPVTLKILDGTQDLFSSFYYLRFLELKENQTSAVNIYYEQRNWSVDVKVGKPFFRDIRKIGSFAVFEVSLDSKLGEFILGKPKMFVYFTADSRRIPLEFKFATSLGLVRGKIQDITQ